MPATPVAAASLPSGHFVLTGSDAAAVVLPAGLTSHQVWAWHDAAFNLDYARYQQYSQTLPVDGAQVTAVSRNGATLIVAGAYYPNLHAGQPTVISPSRALSIAADLRGGLVDLPDAIRAFATRRADLRLDPNTGRPFYLVATAAPGNNGYQQIDALSGQLIAAWGGVDQINPGQGVGVKGDTKTLDPSPFAVVAALTSGSYKLQSNDGKFITYDANGGNALPTASSLPMTDADNRWNTDTPRAAAGVDAQYYAALTVQFYQDVLGYDWMNDCNENPGNAPGFPNKVRSVVHYDYSPNSTPYDNAFWDEQYYYMVYGDGSTVDRPLSAGQDVVSHELSHAVTQCTNNLDYRSESGALNESFSDIMATAAEFAMEEPNSSNCWRRVGQTGCADWLIGEDLAKTASGAAIRDLAHPQAEGQPSHYADRYDPGTCSSGNDFCGVHTNSGIPNHAFYLMAHGGRNARCSGPTDPKADCDVSVPPTTLDDAVSIWFSGSLLLTNNGTMCDLRNSTVAQAALLYSGSVTDIAATILAWQAVGLGANCDQSTDFKISLSDPALALAAGGSGSSQLSLTRLGSNDTIHYAVDKAGPATVSATLGSNAPGNSDGTQIDVTAGSNAADGIYPILVTATGAGSPHYAALSMVIDATPPNAAVTGVGFVAQQVSTSGQIPLSITWTATDGQSGIASAELDHSPNGSGWTAVPGGASSPTQFAYTAGQHQFQVIATDGVGNDTTSPAFIRTLTAYQETDVTLTKALKWKTYNAGTPWGTTIYTGARRATATLTFTGTDVVWIAQRGPKRGVANVFVDGVKTHVDLFSNSPAERKVVFIASGLSAGQHTIKIKVKGTTGRPRVDVDGFFVLS